MCFWVFYLFYVFLVFLGGVCFVFLISEGFVLGCIRFLRKLKVGWVRRGTGSGWTWKRRRL